MADVILFYPRTGVNIKHVSIELPHPVLALAGSLLKANFSVKIIDQRVNDNWKTILKNELKNSPICVGISSMSGFQLNEALKAAEFIKENSNIPIVWGGVHPSLTPRQTLKDKRVDIVVIGEGEATFLELVNSLKKKSSLAKIKGLAYKKDNKIIINPPRPFLNLDKLPNPPYHLINIKDYISDKKTYKYSSLQYLSSRGCPHRCAFCYNCAFNKQQYRMQSPKKVIENIKILKKFGIEGIRFDDDNFFFNKKRVEEILKLMLKEKINLKWFSTTRANYVAAYDDKFLELMKSSGCFELAIGAESGSERILKLIKKDITLEQTYKTAGKCLKYGITPIFSFVMGFPTETNEDRKATFKVIDNLRKMKALVNGIFIYTPNPGTELYELSKKYGLKEPSSLEEWRNYRFDQSNLPWLTKQQEKELKTLYYLARFALFGGKLGAHFKNPLLKLATKTLILSAKFRWQHKFFKFPLEWRLLDKYARAQENE